MSSSKIAQEFPLIEEDEPDLTEQPPEIEEEFDSEPELAAIEEERQSRFAELWEQLSRFGVAEQTVRIGTHVLSLILVLVVVWAMRSFYMQIQGPQTPAEPVVAAAQDSTEEETTPLLPTPLPFKLPEITAAGGPTVLTGISRQALLHTTIPTRSRVDVLTYTVQTGDNLFGIADNFGVKPETILWGNFSVLEDNPHVLLPDQVLNILPVNGTYHQWNEGESLQAVADFYRVDPNEIVEYPGNRMDVALIDMDNPAIDAGTWLIIPNGWRALKDWGPPTITRSNPASARYYGPGHCGSIYEGPIGVGTFVWPTTSRLISGYTYNPSIHPAIDIGGSLGNAIYATDSGVVVYAGWSNFGYGNLLVIDHGNGWQSAYAHLVSLNVGCGQGVFQGSMIGGLGSTGNSSGPHLHFELVFNGAKVNPMDFLQ
jgi:murein DD-endopeptidase MepM/ murein hydrolase activator NlpD